tara:strand:- start:186 stop:461 length:276 start_codon:yes stop_codon:yes gene_type:complete
MKSIFSLTAVALLCASTSFAQQAPTQSEILLGQSGQATVDGQGMFGLGAGLGGAAVAGIVAAVVVVGAAIANAIDDTPANSTNSTNSTNGT